MDRDPIDYTLIDPNLGKMSDYAVAALVSTPDRPVTPRAVCRRRKALDIAVHQPAAQVPADADLTGSWPELMARYPGVSRRKLRHARAQAGIRLEPEQRMKGGRKVGSKMPPRKPRAAPVAPPVAPPPRAPVAAPAPEPVPVRVPPGPVAAHRSEQERDIAHALWRHRAMPERERIAKVSRLHNVPVSVVAAIKPKQDREKELR